MKVKAGGTVSQLNSGEIQSSQSSHTWALHDSTREDKEAMDGDSPFEQNKKKNSVVRACMCVCEEQCGRNYFAKVVHKIAQPASLEILASVFYNGYTSIAL